MTEYEKWIDSLKIGDEVAYYIKPKWTDGYFKIYTVKRLTKTLVVTSGGSFYKKNGEMRGSVSWEKIMPVDKTVTNSIHRRGIERKFQEVIDQKCDLYSTAQLESVVKILSGESDNDRV